MIDTKKKYSYFEIETNIQPQQFEEKDVDLDQIKELALKSSKVLDTERKKRLKRAIDNNDTFYISKELSNVSTIELTKVIFEKLFKKYFHIT